MLSKKKFEKELNHIVEQLIRLYKPDKIILYGSLANNDINEGTDIDLFIIKENVPDIGVDRIRQLDALIKYKLATDFIVYKPEELEKRLQMEDPFVINIFERGRVLYDAI